jgi:anhydro-N-acetylmuramic acid kinase
MNKKYYRVLGVMSGTSLDGVDLALCQFHFNNRNQWNFKIECAETIPYPPHWRQQLKEAIDLPQGFINRLDQDYTQYLAMVIGKFMEGKSISIVDAISSHGHTLFHQPNKGYTLQLGNLPDLAQRLKQKVVCNFRVQDVALGGQGAPLVPIGDRLLFNQYDFCLNLGGFANGSFELDGQRIAFDICPVNVVFNYYAEKLGKVYDDGGRLAASGNLNEELFHSLNALSFYRQPAPKSLGIEWVQAKIFPLLEKSGLGVLDVLRTYTEHIAYQLSLSFKTGQKVLVTGGGAYNLFLMERLRYLVQNEIVIPNSDIVEFKEALVFALLGVLKLRGDINCLSSVTGATSDHSAGYIYDWRDKISD